jgi:1,4-dihydroxy-6-naphthoate synthase
MQMKNRLSLGYSTCPNDTLIFYAMAHELVDCHGIVYDISLGDVERLNEQAENSILDVTKISFAALGHLMERYGLLRSGAALGRGCGPLLVARKQVELSDALENPVAVPGLRTTAGMLLGLFAKKLPPMVPMTFDRIMPAIQSGLFKSGVIIHEGRFTFQQYGLACLVDLGQWWESETGAPIPLGGIAIRRDLPDDVIAKVQKTLRESVVYGLKNRKEAKNYIENLAQEMSPSVINQHIDLYVNEYTVNLGESGACAVETLFDFARQNGLLPFSDSPLFI